MPELRPAEWFIDVLKRGIARMQLFAKVGEYEGFDRVLTDTLRQAPMRACAYCVMPNRWYLLVLPQTSLAMAPGYDPKAFAVLSTNATHWATSSISLGESCSYSIDITP